MYDRNTQYVSHFISCVVYSARIIGAEMGDSLSERKHELIKKVAQDEGIASFELAVKSGSTKGDGYLGLINTIHIRDVERPSKELHLVLKSAMPGEKLREKAPVRKAYEREIYLYETVFPTLRKLSDENGITKQFTEMAKCYGSSFADRDECLLLEDLKHSGFAMWNRKIPMNQEHLEMAFATYGKFHGTSLALKHLRPDKFEELKDNLKNIYVTERENEEDKRKMADNFKQAFGNGFAAINGSKKAEDALTRFAQTAGIFFLEKVRKVDEFSTILHGDCWVNNMMFKYVDVDHPLKPTEMCLLDWQLSSIGSPILDLSYFFYASSSRKDLNNLKHYLKIYYRNLTRTVEDAGVSSNIIFTFEEFEQQWKIYSKYGLFMIFMIFRVILSEVEEAPDLNECAESGHDLMHTLIHTQSVNIQEVNKRIADVVHFMVEQDYL